MNDTTKEASNSSPVEPVVMFKPCPFCGDEPEVETLGTCIVVFCCASMEIQKSDYLSGEESVTWDNKKALFSEDAELKALTVIQEFWNKRETSEITLDDIVKELQFQNGKPVTHQGT